MPSSRSSRTAGAGSRYGSGTRSHPVGDLQYSSVPADVVLRAIDAVVRAGDALVFARTSDGGAYSVRILSTGEVVKYWPTSVDTLVSTLESITEDAIAAI